jgi:acyl-CoA synthetase (NDP forming)
VTLSSHSQTDYSRALRAHTPHVSLLQEADKALRAIERVVRRSELERLAQGVAAAAPHDGGRDAIIERTRALAKAGRGLMPLNEAASKEILRAYGFALPDEVLAASPDKAVEAAQRIGYPVVLKAVAAELTHKSDAGAVALGLATADDVRSAYARISANLARHGFAGTFDGMLVCQQVRGGLELVLGLNRDPEVGLVAMAGSGGVLLELAKDVAFCVPPISGEKALDMLERTRAARLMRGYRGGPVLDMDAAVDALVALGRLAADLGDVIEAVDINPFVVLPRGGMALDALVVLRGGEPTPSISSRLDATC